MKGNDDESKNRETARLRYRPSVVRRLLIAEAPPSSLDRFFYFESVPTHDRLFLEVIHAIYRFEHPEISIPAGIDTDDRLPSTRQLRPRKAEFLSMFKNDGFYLIDSIDTPFPDLAAPSLKRKMIDEGIPDLIKKVRGLQSNHAEIVLISPRAHRTRKRLEEEGFSIANRGVIDFPLSTGRRPFLKKMTELLKPYYRDNVSAG